MLRAVIALALLASACGSDPEEAEPPCVALPAECPDVLPPEYPRLYSAIFQGSCSQANGTCHGSIERQGGLDLSDIDRGYTLLLERVEKGNPSCSKLVVRTHSIGKPWQMPPGAPLEAFELCAIREWIETGAPR